MRGFFLSVLGLSALYVVLQDRPGFRAADNLSAAGKVASALFGRLGDPTVAGIRQTLHGGIGVLGPVNTYSGPFTITPPAGGGGGGTPAHPLSNPSGGIGPVLQA